MSESEPVFYEIYCPNGCFEPAPFPYGEIRNWNIKCIICGEFCMMNYEKKYKVVLNPNRLDEDELKKGGSMEKVSRDAYYRKDPFVLSLRHEAKKSESSNCPEGAGRSTILPPFRGAVMKMKKKKKKKKISKVLWFDNTLTELPMVRFGYFRGGINTNEFCIECSIEKPKRNAKRIRITVEEI